MASGRIGFVGLGAMGGNMARRLAGLGFTVAGYDPSATNAMTMTRVLIIRWRFLEGYGL